MPSTTFGTTRSKKLGFLITGQLILSVRWPTSTNRRPIIIMLFDVPFPLGRCSQRITCVDLIQKHDEENFQKFLFVAQVPPSTPT